MNIKKEDLNGNWTPIQSSLYATEQVEKTLMPQLDFWGRSFLRLSLLLGACAVIAGGGYLLVLVVSLLMHKF